MASLRPREPPRFDGLAGHHRGLRVARVHGIGVHDPGHGLFIGIHVGRGNVDLRPDEIEQLRGVAARDALQLAHGMDVGIADDAALAAAEGDVDHGALPGHPGGQRAHLVKVDVGSVADAALGRSARNGMLHAIAGEHLQPPVVQHHGDVHDDLARRRPQNFLHAFIQAQALSGFIEARLGGKQRVELGVGALRG